MVNSLVPYDHLETLFQESSEDLTADEKHQLQQLLIGPGSTFSKNAEVLSSTHLLKHTIDVGGAKPVKWALRCIQFTYAREDRKALDQLMTQGCIQPSNVALGCDIGLCEEEQWLRKVLPGQTRIEPVRMHSHCLRQKTV